MLQVICQKQLEKMMICLKINISHQLGFWLWGGFTIYVCLNIFKPFFRILGSFAQSFHFLNFKSIFSSYYCFVLLLIAKTVIKTLMHKMWGLLKCSTVEDCISKGKLLPNNMHHTIQFLLEDLQVVVIEQGDLWVMCVSV